MCADRNVQHYLESLVPELQALMRVGMMNTAEVKAVVSQRRNFEVKRESVCVCVCVCVLNPSLYSSSQPYVMVVSLTFFLFISLECWETIVQRHFGCDTLSMK